MVFRFIRNIFDKLGKIKGILLGEDGPACPCFDISSGISGNGSSLFGNLFVLFQSMGIQGLSQFSGCRFRKHGKNQLQRGHVVSKIFFLQVFEILVLASRHPRPCFGNFIGEDGIFHTFPYAVVAPRIRELFSDLNRLKSLIDPFSGIAFSKICLQSSVNDELRIDNLIDSFFSYLRQPHFKRFGFR